MSNLHGKVVSSGFQIPQRTAFLDQGLFKSRNQAIHDNKPVRFLSINVHEISVQVEAYKPWQFRLFNIGVLDDGRKVCVMYNNMPAYFEVMLEEKNPHKQAEDLFATLQEQELNPKKFDVCKGKPFAEYQAEDSYFAKFYFAKLKDRKEAIQYMVKRGYKTYSDDMSSYYRMLSRTYSLPFSGWIVLNKYHVTVIPHVTMPVFAVNHEDVVSYDGDVMADSILSKFPFVVMAWDIETYSPDTGLLPLPTREKDRVFCISMVFYFGLSREPFLKVCLIDVPSSPNDDYITMQCYGEKDLLETFGRVAAQIKPEFVIGFNDSDYDWNWLLERAKKYKGLLIKWNKSFNMFESFRQPTDKEVYQTYYKGFSIKAEANKSIHGRALTFPSFVPLDVRTAMRKLNPTDELTSLNYFLSKYHLPSKLDMPPKELNKRYDSAFKALKSKNKGLNKEEVCKLAKSMSEVALYCVADSKRCQDLMCKTSTWLEYMELARASYCSFNDAYMRANGMKVRNVVIQYGQQFGYKFSNISKPIKLTTKYEGAYVIAPNKGLKTSKASIRELVARAEETKSDNKWSKMEESDVEACEKFIRKCGITWKDSFTDNDAFKKLSDNAKDCLIEFLKTPNTYPVTALDFASLYPSLIMRGNYSLERMVLDPKIVSDAKEGDLYPIKFTYGDSTIKAWMKWHHNDINPKNFGIYPSILKKLFEQRKQLKGLMAPLKEKLEKLESEKKKDCDEYIEAEFKYNYFDSKQRAAKVFMNTFYGETGNSKSPFFALPIAGGITSDGRMMLHAVEKHLRERGCTIHYGDTDSIYMSLPGDLYEEFDKLYYGGKISKLEYWTQIVNVTFKFNDEYRDEVNTWISKTFNTPFLKMAYEEVLWPAVLLSKKKYYGLEHKNMARFVNPKLFIKDMEIKKRGPSPLLKKISEEVIRESLDVNNTKTLMQIVLDKIKSIFERKWVTKDFVQTAEYKPPTKEHPGNPRVITFVKRMKDEDIIIPPGERFEYVLVKKYPYQYDMQGRKSKISVGDKMELVENLEKKKCEIDIDSYMTGGIVGVLARFVTYDSRFQETGTNADKKMQENAKKFIIDQCQPYFTQYVDKGKIYKETFSKVKPLVNQIMNSNMQCKLEPGLTLKKDIIDTLVKTAEKRAQKIVTASYGKRYVTNRLKQSDNEDKCFSLLTKIYRGKGNNMCEMQKRALEKRKRTLIHSMNFYSDKGLTYVYDVYNEALTEATNFIRKGADLDSKYTDGSLIPKLAEVIKESNIDLDVMKEKVSKLVEEKSSGFNFTESQMYLNYFYVNLVSMYVSYMRYQQVADYLKIKRCKDTHQAVRPDTDEVRDIIGKSVQWSMKN